MCWGLSNVSYHGDGVLVKALVQYLFHCLPSLDVRDFTTVAWSLVVFGLELVQDVGALQAIVVHATKICAIAKSFDQMDQSVMQLCEFVSYAVGVGLARAPTAPWCVERRPGGYISKFRSDIYQQVCLGDFGNCAISCHAAAIHYPCHGTQVKQVLEDAGLGEKYKTEFAFMDEVSGYNIQLMISCDDGRRIAVEGAGPNWFCRSKDLRQWILKGSKFVRKRALQSLGYTYVMIPYYHWKDADEKDAFCEKLKELIAMAPPRVGHFSRVRGEEAVHARSKNVHDATPVIEAPHFFDTAFKPPPCYSGMDGATLVTCGE